jgi:hypothetical protein
MATFDNKLRVDKVFLLYCMWITEMFIRFTVGNPTMIPNA